MRTRNTEWIVRMLKEWKEEKPEKKNNQKGNEIRVNREENLGLQELL